MWLPLSGTERVLLHWHNRYCLHARRKLTVCSLVLEAWPAVQVSTAPLVLSHAAQIKHRNSAWPLLPAGIYRVSTHIALILLRTVLAISGNFLGAHNIAVLLEDSSQNSQACDVKNFSSTIIKCVTRPRPSPGWMTVRTFVNSMKTLGEVSFLYYASSKWP